MSSVHCNERPTETRPSLAGPSRSGTPRAGPEQRKQSLIDNTHRLDTEDHFRTDVSYLPDLTGYLDDLLRTRERLAAGIDGVDEWARADAMPAAEEIRRVRHLVSQIKGDIDRMDAGAAQIDEAVSVVRRHRALHLGMPSVRPVLPSPRTEASA